MVIDKEKWKALLENPHSVNAEEAALLKTILTRFPYFQLAHALYARHLKRTDEELFEKWLPRVAALTSDRNRLYEWMHEEIRPVKPAITKTLPATHQTSAPPASISGDIIGDKNTDNPSVQEKEKEKILPDAEKDASPTQEAPAEEPKTYIEWIKYLSRNTQTVPQAPAEKKDRTLQLIDRFLEKQPKIQAPGKKTSIPPPPEAEKSIREHTGLMTETLAGLYEKQGKWEKAIRAYEILKLKYPEKNRYFASKIAELRHLLNQKNN